MNARILLRFRAAAILLAVILAYVLVPEVSRPTPAAAMRTHQTSGTVLCGTVSAYTAATSTNTGLITLNGNPYTIAAGATLTPANPSITTNSTVCLTGLTVTAGYISAATVATVTPTTQTVCGTVTNYNPNNPSPIASTFGNGTITIGGTIYPIVASAIFTGNAIVANNQNQCFQLSLNGAGQIVSANVTANNPGSSLICGPVTSYTAPQANSAGTIIINGVQYTIIAGSSVSGVTPSAGTSVCLQITQNGAGQITGATATAYAPTTQTICGTVSAYTAPVAATGTAVGSNGSITINGTQYTIVSGATFTGSPISNGANLCFTATLAGSNQITGATVNTNTSNSQTVCGTVSNYTAATSSSTGTITIGTTPYTIAQGVTLTPATGVTIQNGASLCFQLTTSATGQITSATVTAFSPNSTVCGVVSAYTPATSSANGSITIGGQTYVITIGTSFSGVPVSVNSNQCFQLSLNTANQITAGVVTANSPTVTVVCGTVTAYVPASSTTAGSITIGTTTYTLAAGSTVVGNTIAVGQSLCFNFTLNGANQVTAVTVTPNTPSTLTVCGVVSNYTAATATVNGAITINGTPYTIVAGSVLTTPSGVTVQNGVNLCFQLTLNGAGQITAATVSAATTPTSTLVPPTNQTVCGTVSNYIPPTTSSFGSITISGQTYTIAPGTAIAGATITPNANLCFQFVLNGMGEVTSIVAAFPTSTPTPTPTATSTTTPVPTPTAPASAQIVLSPGTQAAGPSAAVTVTGGGFASNENVTVSYVARLTTGGTAVEQTTVTTFGNGTFIAPSLPVPASVVPGTYQVMATGQSSQTTTTAWLAVLAPLPTETPTVTNTPVPTATSERTNTPVPTSTSIPSVVIETGMVMHTVKRKQQETQTLRPRERATFLVLYHLVNAAGLTPSSTLTVTKNGKVLVIYQLQRMVYHGHAGFWRTFNLPRSASAGKLYAHFKVVLGSSTVKRDRRFYVKAQR